MFGDYIGRGSAGGVFTSPTDPNQVIKIMNLNSRVEMVRHMNRLQLQFFEELEAQQKQGVKTPGLPNISYTFTGEMNPAIMEQMRNSILDRNLVYPEDEYLSALDYSGKVMLEIAQQEAIQMDLVHPVKALQVKMDKAHHPKYVANVMAQVVKHPLMTCLTTLEKKECLKLKRLLINRQQKISLNSKPNVVINAKSVLTWQKKPKTNVK